MDTRVEAAQRSTLATLVAVLVGLGLIRVAARFTGFVALLGVVLASVFALTVGILILRLLVLH